MLTLPSVYSQVGLSSLQPLAESATPRAAPLTLQSPKSWFAIPAEARLVLDIRLTNIAESAINYNIIIVVLIVRWLHSSMIFHSSMVPPFHGSTVPTVPQFHGSIVPSFLQFHGSTVPWFHGSIVPWFQAFHGSKRSLVPWFHSSMVPPFHSSMEPWKKSEKLDP